MKKKQMGNEKASDIKITSLHMDRKAGVMYIIL